MKRFFKLFTILFSVCLVFGLGLYLGNSKNKEDALLVDVNRADDKKEKVSGLTEKEDIARMLDLLLEQRTLEASEQGLIGVRDTILLVSSARNSSASKTHKELLSIHTNTVRIAADGFRNIEASTNYPLAKEFEDLAQASAVHLDAAAKRIDEGLLKGDEILIQQASDHIAKVNLNTARMTEIVAEQSIR